MLAHGRLFFWSLISILLSINLHVSLARKKILDCDSDKILFNSSRHDKRIPEFLDFKGRIAERLRDFVKSNKLELEWFDVDGSKAKEIVEEYNLESNPANYKVFATTSKTSYGSGIRCRRLLAEEKDTFSICNPLKKPMSLMVPAIDIVIRNEASWTVDDDLKNMDIDFDMPDDFETDDEESVHKSKGGEGSRSKANSQIFTFSSNVTVDPGKVLVLRYVTMKEEVELPYVNELSLTGNISVKYKQEFNGSEIGSFPITYFAGQRFPKRDDGLVFNCSGIFRGVRGITTHIYYNEWPLKKNHRKCNHKFKPGEHSDNEHSDNEHSDDDDDDGDDGDGDEP